MTRGAHLQSLHYGAIFQTGDALRCNSCRNVITDAGDRAGISVSELCNQINSSHLAPCTYAQPCPLSTKHDATNQHIQEYFDLDQYESKFRTRASGFAAQCHTASEGTPMSPDEEHTAPGGYTRMHQAGRICRQTNDNSTRVREAAKHECGAAVARLRMGLLVTTHTGTRRRFSHHNTNKTQMTRTRSSARP
jgi:hypothetical protein